MVGPETGWFLGKETIDRDFAFLAYYSALGVDVKIFHFKEVRST